MSSTEEATTATTSGAPPGHIRLAAYPLQLGIAYLFLGGYCCRCLFVSWRLPASVGVMFSGLVFSYCFQDSIYHSRDDLQDLAFFLVLLTAGLDISLRDLKPHTFVMALLPPTLELAGIAAYAVFVLEFEVIEGLVLGTTLFSVGDGLVIPKMKEFQTRFPSHPLPFLVFTTVPLEASYALALFGILEGMSEPANASEVGPKTVAFANVLRIVATVVGGSLLGMAAAYLVELRVRLTCCGRKVFSGKPVEAFLMLVSAGLVAYGLGSAEGGKAVVPIGFASGALFQPELMVIITASVFAECIADEEDLIQLESILGGVWVFGQVILFSMLGSKTRLRVFTKLVDTLPVIGSGLLCRAIGVLLAVGCTRRWRLSPEELLNVDEEEEEIDLDDKVPPVVRSRSPSPLDDTWRQASAGGGTSSRGPLAGRRASQTTRDQEEMKQMNTASFLPDAVFCFLSCLPRATIQGALGNIPMLEGFFQSSSNKAQVDVFISEVARLYIVVMAVVGMTLLSSLGDLMLQTSAEWALLSRSESTRRRYSTLDSSQSTPPLNTLISHMSVGSGLGEEEPLALLQLAERLDILPGDLSEALKEAGVHLMSTANSENEKRPPVAEARLLRMGIHEFETSTNNFEMMMGRMSTDGSRSAAPFTGVQSSPRQSLAERPAGLGGRRRMTHHGVVEERALDRRYSSSFSAEGGAATPPEREGSVGSVNGSPQARTVSFEDRW